MDHGRVAGDHRVADFLRLYAIRTAYLVYQRVDSAQDAHRQLLEPIGLLRVVDPADDIQAAHDLIVICRACGDDPCQGQGNKLHRNCCRSHIDGNAVMPGRLVPRLDIHDIIQLERADQGDHIGKLLYHRQRIVEVQSPPVFLHGACQPFQIGQSIFLLRCRHLYQPLQRQRIVLPFPREQLLPDKQHRICFIDKLSTFFAGLLGDLDDNGFVENAGSTRQYVAIAQGRA